MVSVENTEVTTVKNDESKENNSNTEQNSENMADKSQQSVTPPEPSGTPTKSSDTPAESKKKKRKHKIPTINLEALKELEGTTTSSFLDLARAVILINGTPYDEVSLPMSNARKQDFERLIAHHAQLVIYGKRKYYIKSVITRKPKEELNDVELKVIRERPYVEFSKEEIEKRRKRYEESKAKKIPQKA